MKGNHEKAQATLPVYSVAWALARAFTAKGKYGKARTTLDGLQSFSAIESSKSLGNYEGQPWET